MTEKKESNSLRTFLGILVIGIIIFVMVYNDFSMNNQRKKEDDEYIQIEKYKNEYKGRLLSKQISKGYKGLTLMHLTNNAKFSISESTRNYLYSGQDLDYFIQIGDSIFKPANSDSLFIIRKDRTYYFIIGKIISK